MTNIRKGDVVNRVMALEPKERLEVMLSAMDAAPDHAAAERLVREVFEDEDDRNYVIRFYYSRVVL